MLPTLVMGHTGHISYILSALSSGIEPTVFPTVARSAPPIILPIIIAGPCAAVLPIVGVISVAPIIAIAMRATGVTISATGGVRSQTLSNHLTMNYRDPRAIFCLCNYTKLYQLSLYF